jgi:hypothetical protein
MRLVKLFTLVLALGPFLGGPVYAQKCVTCHKVLTPGIVTDWQLSKHSQNEVDCATCHGDEHTNAKNVEKAQVPTAETCAMCHE